MNCCTVKRKVTLKTFLPLIIVALITLALSVVASMFFAFIPLLIIIAGIIVIIAISPALLRTEYEYNIEGETFSIAIIKNNSSRKEIFSCNMHHLVSCVPLNEADLIYTSNKINAYVEGITAYYAVFTQEEQTACVTFSPSDDFIKSMRLIAPLKVKVNIL